MDFEPELIPIEVAIKRGIVCLVCGARFDKDKLKVGLVFYKSEFGTIAKQAMVCPQCGSNDMDFALNG